MRVLFLGASRNTGYFVTQRLVAKGHTCILLLRRPEVMEADPAMNVHISEGKIKVVPGDGLVEADVQRAWDVAKSDGEVDMVFFGIGGEPQFSFTQGFIMTPADLTARSMAVLLSVIQSSTTPTTRPKLLTVTANGLNGRQHSILPFVLRLFYKWLLKVPHHDKLKQEEYVERAAGWGGGNDGWLGAQNVVIVRPSMFTSGACKADRGGDAYRTGQELKGAWTVSRADVAHFIGEKVFANWGEWAGRAWVISD
ncbi:hypothetical protein BDV93DRAFT_444796 [Ceratobasidium sp. AG-I]|nr:hypothetical protein BDV93DRAFT_444796 [Ceratobasidium sp. AG-I]